MIGDRVGIYDYTGIPQAGVVVYEKPHKTEPGIFWLGISLDNPSLNVLDLQTEKGTIIVGAYERSDNVYPLKD